MAETYAWWKGRSPAVTADVIPLDTGTAIVRLFDNRKEVSHGTTCRPPDARLEAVENLFAEPADSLYRDPF